MSALTTNDFMEMGFAQACMKAADIAYELGQLRVEIEATHTKLAQFTKWNSELTAKCNWYNCDGARLEREIEALKQQVSELEHTRDVLHESYIRHLEELDLANQRLVSEEYANSLNNSVIDALHEQVEQGKRDAVPDWLPIETAPKDCGFLGYQSMSEDTWIIAPMYWSGSEWLIIQFHSDNTEHSMQPTHWQPIAAAPKQEK